MKKIAILTFSMANINIETAQNISIQYEPASVADRIVAWLIDFMLFLGYAGGIMIIIQLMGLSKTDYVFLLIPASFYHLVMEIFNRGRSLGKMSMSIKVIHRDGAHPSLGSYLIRWVFRLIENVFFFAGGVAIFTMLLGNRGQRLGDLVAGTTVVKEKSRVKLSDTLFENIAEGYEPIFQYQNLERLSEKDIQLVKEFLASRVYRKKPEMAIMTAEKVKNVTEIASTLEPINFLKQVLKDYNYYYQKEIL